MVKIFSHLFYVPGINFKQLFGNISKTKEMYLSKKTVKKSGLLFLWMVLLFSKTLVAQTDSSHMRISLLTCAPGDELYATFGHTAIRIIDSTQHTDYIYNYGTFDFDDPDFYIKFTRGKLDYFLSVQTVPQFMYEYQVENRNVYEQELAVSGDTKRAIVKALSDNMQGANRYYKYDFQYNNCTSRVRDILIQYAGLKVEHPIVPQGTTFRNLLHNYLDRGGKSWSKLGIDLVLGSPVDKKVNIEESMFLPDYLMKGADSALSANQSTLLSKKTLLYTGTRTDEPNRNWSFIVFSVAAILIGSISFIKNKTAQTITRVFDFILLLGTGLIGCLLLFMWFGTDHKSCAANYNLLWALPTHLIAAFAVWKNPPWLRKYFTVCAFLYALVLITWFWLPQQINPALIPVTLLFLARFVQLRKA